MPTNEEVLRNTCLYVTGKCNGSCIFCHSPTFYISSESQNGSLDKLKRYVDIAVAIGSNSFVLTGGEPLLYEYLFELIRYIKKMNCKVYLNTNAIEFNTEVIDNILKSVDILGLPLESPDYRVNERLGRGKSSRKVIEFLKEYEIRNYREKIRIKIATVATAINSKLIPDMGEIIPRDIYLWKVYQFCVRGRGIQHKGILYLSNEEFLRIEHKTKARNPNHNIFFATSESIDKSNFVVLPDGNVVTPNGEGYIQLGNIINKKTQELLQEIWISHRYRENSKRTYMAEKNSKYQSKKEETIKSRRRG